jgi:hypothetical protein
MKTGMIALGLATFATVAPAKADCRFMPFRFYWGQNASAALNCTGARQFRWVPRMGHASTVTGISITSPAKNGTVSASGTYMLYAPKAGFKGTDNFVVTISGTGPNGAGQSTVSVSVNLQ